MSIIPIDECTITVQGTGFMAEVSYDFDDRVVRVMYNDTYWRDDEIIDNINRHLREMYADELI